MTRFWKFLFFTLPILYGMWYAPYGINETDGGFLTGLGWQVIQGQTLYEDMIYVRPPLSVWIRALEIYWIPDTWAILGERWIFYIKVATYSYLGAAILYSGQRRWILAIFGYLCSVYCYPAAAWHTIDGIFFAVVGVWFATHFTDHKRLWVSSGLPFLGGICIAMSLLCKQSFYPLVFFFIGFLLVFQGIRYKKALLGLAGMFSGLVIFITYLIRNNLWEGFIQNTTQSASSGQAIQHGVLDYFKITPELALPSAMILFLVFFWKNTFLKPNHRQWIFMFWVLALPLSFAAVTWLRQEHTVPFAQSRILFWVATFQVLLSVIHHQNYKPAILLSIAWCSAVSWGHNLPLLFATPLVWAIMETIQRLEVPEMFKKYGSVALMLILLGTFRLGYEFIYRDGRRSEMQAHLGDIFPRLRGIYSNPETAAQYKDLKRIAGLYSPNFVVLPAFPQAHYLTNTKPILALGWVVNRETNHHNDLIINQLEALRPVLVFEKSQLQNLHSDPQLSLCKTYFDKSTTLEETAYFIVKKL